jgi:uncharacterized protein DUF2505
VTHFSITHDFEGEPAAFWKLFFHEPYNVDLYNRIGVKERKVLQHDEDDEKIRFSLRIMPKRDLPGVIKKIVGGDLGYTEISTYWKQKSLIDVRIEPTLLKERTKLNATYTVKPIGPGRIRLTFEGDIHVDLPLVGRKVEATVLEDLKRTYDVVAQVTAEWLKKGT